MTGPIWWMSATTIGSWLIVTAVAGRRVNPELLFGLLGPLVSAIGTWIAVVRAYRSAPEGLTGVMVMGFMAKLAFFAVYVIGIVRVLAARPVPFVVSFMSYFIALYAMEAIFLRRLLHGPGSSTSEPATH